MTEITIPDALSYLGSPYFDLDNPYFTACAKVLLDTRCPAHCHLVEEKAATIVESGKADGYVCVAHVKALNSLEKWEDSSRHVKAYLKQAQEMRRYFDSYPDEIKRAHLEKSIMFLRGELVSTLIRLDPKTAALKAEEFVRKYPRDQVFPKQHLVALLKIGQIDRALEKAEMYISRHPGKRALRGLHIEALIASGRTADADMKAKDYIRNDPSDQILYGLHVSVWQAVGNHAEAGRLEAEYYDDNKGTREFREKVEEKRGIRDSAARAAVLRAPALTGC